MKRKVREAEEEKKKNDAFKRQRDREDARLRRRR